MTEIQHEYERCAVEGSLAEFVNSARDKPWHGEYVLVEYDQDDRALHCYRATGEPGDRECVKTVIRNVGLSAHGDHEPKGFSLHSRDAETFLTWVNSLKWERTHTRVTVDWWEQCGRPMMDGRGVSMETLTFEYRTESGTERSVHIESPWSVPSHRIANFK